MLSPRAIAAAERLLTEGVLSHREIARRCGLGRSTVNDLANGVDRPRRALALAPGDRRIPVRGKVGRCPGCNCDVELPCVACIVSGIVDEAGRVIAAPEPVAYSPLAASCVR